MAVKKVVVGAPVPDTATEPAQTDAAPAAEMATAAANETEARVEVAASAPAKPVVKAAKTPEEVSQKLESVMKTAEDFVSFGQGNVEAFMKAGQIWAAGVQDLSKQFAATAQAQMDQTVATFKALAGVKSVKEAVDLQTELARTSMEKVMAETGKLTDASLKLTEQTFAPITARVTVAMEKFGTMEKFGRTAA